MMDARGVSEVLSVLIVTSLISAFGFAYLAVYQARGTAGVMGIVDIIRAQEHRQNELLSLVFSGENHLTRTLRAYLYNYGTWDVVTDRFYLDQQEVDPYQFNDITTGEPVGDGVIRSHHLVELVFRNRPLEGDNYLTVVTKWGGAFSWRV